MKSTSSTRRASFALAKRWSGVAVIAMGVLFSAHIVNAAPPAGTPIGNQATASYLDPNGNVQLATSNPVVTTVQQVGSLTLDASGTQTAGAGATLYVAHTLTNTGNGSDQFTIAVTENNAGTAPDFTRIEVYRDPGTGMPDGTTPLCSITTPTGTCTVPAQTVAGNGGTFKFVVGYSIPPTATIGTWPNNVATVTAAAVASAVPYTVASVTNTDTINLTDQAAFAVTKSISQPAVAAGTAVAWPNPLASGPRGSRTIFTFSYINNGNSPGTFYIADALPAGFTYVPNSAVWSSAPGTYLDDAAGAETVPGIEFEAVGQNVRARIATVNPSSAGSLSIVVDVTSGAAIGVTQTSNTALYSPLTCAATTIATSGVCATATTNAAAFTVLAQYDVAFGMSPTPATDTIPGTPNSSNDTVTRPDVVPGGSVRFTQVVQNTGNGTDTFNLSVTGAGATGTAFPAGTTFSWFQSDGVTPLLDYNNDGIIDTGTMAPGALRTIVLQATVPSSTLVGSGPYSVTARATSASDTSQFDAVQDVVTVVIGALVDLTNTAAGTGSGGVANGDLGPGPSPSPTIVTSGTSGFVTSIEIFVKNNDTAANSYTLSASQQPSFPGTLPAGYTVIFSSSACASPTPVTTIGPLAPGAQTSVFACVSIPLSASAGQQSLYFQARSTAPSATTGGVLTDTLHDAVNVVVAAVKRFTVSPDNTGQASSGGTVVYAHTITNTGNQTCGAFNIAASGNWSTALYLDVNGDGAIDGGDTLLTGSPLTLPALAGGASQKVLVRVFVPGGLSAGAQDVTTVTVSDPTSACPLAGSNPTDITSVVTGQVRLAKKQAADVTCDGIADTGFTADPLTLRPGQCLLYEVIATNQGLAPVNNVSISDAVPPNTNYAGAVQPASQCSSTNLTGTAVAYANNGATVSCGSAVNVLSPSGTISLYFAVQITP